MNIVDIFVIGGGVNGCGIARDAAGRGLSVVLAEKGDLASGTSSASTKLFHGGLRYLEYFEVRLVRESLIERERLLRAMPHISWPMRFVLPINPAMRFEGKTPASRLLNTVMPWTKGRRPAWLIRLGLALYDSLGGRKVLPGTRTLDLAKDSAGIPLKPGLRRAFEYSDCWVDDSRLVALNARDAAERGARILTRAEVVAARRDDAHWHVDIRHAGGEVETVVARTLVNAGGPWVREVISGALGLSSTEGVRLDRGSHIVTKRLFDHDRCYFFQGEDGRIIFAIPYETDFTLIGTTDQEHHSVEEKPVCTDEEARYLCDFASSYFKTPITPDDIVWTYSGVRPLYDDGATSAAAATRDYVLSLDEQGPLLLNVFGGKITTYRRLAENALARIAPAFSGMQADWTEGVALPGGDFKVGTVPELIERLGRDYPWLSPFTARRLIRAYGTDAWQILGDAAGESDCGETFGEGLTAREVDWLTTQEFARTADDVLWRRSKLGLRMPEDGVAALEAYMRAAFGGEQEDA